MAKQAELTGMEGNRKLQDLHDAAEEYKVVMFKLWPILDALKIPRCGLHAFRHFHSTMLLELGAAPQVAQAQMRHSDPRITLAVYSHVVPESQRTAVDKVAEILAPIGPKTERPGEWIQ